MTGTSLSLLDRLRCDPTAADWQRLHAVYRPLIRGWLARVPGLGDEADDVTQEVLVVVLREVVNFERRREGSFRAWLRRVTVHRVRQFWRDRRRRPLVGIETGGDETEHFLARLEDPASDLSRQWDADHDRHVTTRLLAAVERDFRPHVWAAFRRFFYDGLPAAAAAAELGMTEAAVFLAKARVLKRLREEAGVMLDER